MTMWIYTTYTYGSMRIRNRGNQRGNNTPLIDATLNKGSEKLEKYFYQC